jgi:hypothetical protein
LLNCPEYGQAEFVQGFSVQTPVEGLTHVSTRFPELDVILFVGHFVLATCQLEVHDDRMEVVAHPDNSKEGADGSKSGLGWWDTTGVIGEVQNLDKRVQL